MELSVRLRIKPGVVVWQDFRIYRWPDELADIIFDKCEVSPSGGVRLRADGFGHLNIRGDIGEYGNGAIFLHAQTSQTKPA